MTSASSAVYNSQNIPYARDLSAYNEAWENSQKWFEEWKNSIDPEEYQAIIKETAARFDRKLELRIERCKQIAEDRERRAKEEAERLAQQAEAESAGADESEEPPEPGPPPPLTAQTEADVRSWRFDLRRLRPSRLRSARRGQKQVPWLCPVRSRPHNRALPLTGPRSRTHNRRSTSHVQNTITHHTPRFSVCGRCPSRFRPRRRTTHVGTRTDRA